MGLAIVLTYLVKTQGPGVAAQMNKELDADEVGFSFKKYNMYLFKVAE